MFYMLIGVLMVATGLFLSSLELRERARRCVRGR